MSGSEPHTCIATSTGTLSCWGRNDDGELGNGMMGFNATAPFPSP